MFQMTSDYLLKKEQNRAPNKTLNLINFISCILVFCIKIKVKNISLIILENYYFLFNINNS